MTFFTKEIPVYSRNHDKIKILFEKYIFLVLMFKNSKYANLW